MKGPDTAMTDTATTDTTIPATADFASDPAAVREVFLATLDDTLAASGWIRTDSDRFGTITPEYTHPSSPVTLTITGAVWTRPGACLWRDDHDALWNVGADNPDANTLAAAANATLPNAETPRALTDLLDASGWPVEHEYEAGRLLETRWTSPDGTEVAHFPGDRFDAPGWLISRPGTANGKQSRAQYAPAADTPAAVLSALIFDR
jgi:hypothetical protein